MVVGGTLLLVLIAIAIGAFIVFSSSHSTPVRIIAFLLGIGAAFGSLLSWGDLSDTTIAGALAILFIVYGGTLAREGKKSKGATAIGVFLIIIGVFALIAVTQATWIGDVFSSSIEAIRRTLELASQGANSLTG